MGHPLFSSLLGFLDGLGGGGGGGGVGEVEIGDGSPGGGGGGEALLEFLEEGLILLVEKLSLLPQPLVLLHDIAVLHVQFRVQLFHFFSAEKNK